MDPTIKRPYRLCRICLENNAQPVQFRSKNRCLYRWGAWTPPSLRRRGRRRLDRGDQQHRKFKKTMLKTLSRDEFQSACSLPYGSVKGAAKMSRFDGGVSSMVEMEIETAPNTQ